MASTARVRARAALRQLIADKGWSISHFAREMGVSQPSASGWVTGGSRPDAHLRLKIERLYGIKADWWMTDAEYRSAFGHTRAA